MDVSPGSESQFKGGRTKNSTEVIFSGPKHAVGEPADGPPNLLPQAQGFRLTGHQALDISTSSTSPLWGQTTSEASSEHHHPPSLNLCWEYLLVLHQDESGQAAPCWRRRPHRLWKFGLAGGVILRELWYPCCRCTWTLKGPCPPCSGFPFGTYSHTNRWKWNVRWHWKTSKRLLMGVSYNSEPPTVVVLLFDSF